MIRSDLWVFILNVLLLIFDDKPVAVQFCRGKKRKPTIFLNVQILKKKITPSRCLGLFEIILLACSNYNFLLRIFSKHHDKSYRLLFKE